MPRCIALLALCTAGASAFRTAMPRPAMARRGAAVSRSATTMRAADEGGNAGGFAIARRAALTAAAAAWALPPALALADDSGAEAVDLDAFRAARQSGLNKANLPEGRVTKVGEPRDRSQLHEQALISEPHLEFVSSHLGVRCGRISCDAGVRWFFWTRRWRRARRDVARGVKMRGRGRGSERAARPTRVARWRSQRVDVRTTAGRRRCGSFDDSWRSRLACE